MNQNLTDSEKIDYLIQKVEALEKSINPPFWKTFLFWFLNHIPTIFLLGITLYLLWQVWEVVLVIQKTLDIVEIKVTGFKDLISTQFLNFSEKLEPFKNLDLEKLKFWE